MLGGRQHGHLEAVGYDLYIRLLSEALQKSKGQQPSQEAAECVIDLRLDAHIPEYYIENLSQRLDVYKKIASIQTTEQQQDVLDELIDRFGEPPKSVVSLSRVALLRNVLAGFGFEEIGQRGDTLLLYPHTLDFRLGGGAVGADEGPGDGKRCRTALPGGAAESQGRTQNLAGDCRHPVRLEKNRPDKLTFL